MCGISGLYLKYGEIAERRMLEAMTSTMEWRGPDADGFYNDKHLGLAHRRLKVIDLSDDANQPMHAISNRYSIVFNGEIYNYRELRAELESKSYKFKTSSDTEVLLKAYIEWGEKLLTRLNGIFAFAVYDKHEQSLHIARDRFGIKPLFYSFDGERLAFASSVSAIMSVPWVKKNISNETIFAFLKFSHIPNPASIIDSIRQVKPGHYLSFTHGSLSEIEYWNSTELSNPQRILDLDEFAFIEQLELALMKSVKAQSVSDVPLGCFLSGGIDSSLISYYLAQCSDKPVKSFSIGYKEQEFDESAYARQVANNLGFQHFEYIVSPEDFFEFIPDIPKYFDQPLADPTLLPSMLLASKSRREVTVALSGDGGDELFFGYEFQQALYRLQIIKDIPHSLRAPVCKLLQFILYPLYTRQPRLQQINKLLDILQFRNTAELFQYFIGTIGPIHLDKINQLLKTPIQLKIPLYSELMGEIEGLTWPAQIEQVFLKRFLPDTVLAKTDRTSMAFSLEARVPFLDNEMINFASSLPFNMKYQKGVKKYMLRKLTAQHLPREIAYRKKQGFSIPMREWIRGDLKYLVLEYLRPEKLKNDPHLNEVTVSRLIKKHMNKQANHSHLIWSMISLQMWKQHYKL